MNSKCDQKLLKTVAFSNVCICSGEPNQKEHTHFHPSNDITPSDTDVRLTKQMEEACQLVGLELFDHIIVGSDGERYFSFCEAGMLSRSAKVEPDIAVASPRKVR